MARKAQYDPETTVIMIWGKAPVERFMDSMSRSKEDLDLILGNTKIYTFDSWQEAEAFRAGVITAQQEFEMVCPDAIESCELTVDILGGLQALCNPEVSRKRKAA